MVSMPTFVPGNGLNIIAAAVVEPFCPERAASGRIFPFGLRGQAQARFRNTDPARNGTEDLALMEEVQKALRPGDLVPRNVFDRQFHSLVDRGIDAHHLAPERLGDGCR